MDKRLQKVLVVGSLVELPVLGHTDPVPAGDLGPKGYHFPPLPYENLPSPAQRAPQAADWLHSRRESAFLLGFFIPPRPLILWGMRPEKQTRSD